MTASLLGTLDPPPGETAVPAFRDGWLEPGADEPRPFLSYLAEPADVHWSSELESLHEESSRTHFIDVLTRKLAIHALEPQTLGEHPVIVDLGCSTGHLLRDLEAECRRLADVLARPRGPWFVVSNEVGLGIVPDNALARRFRDVAGRLNQQVAAVANNVLMMVAGLPLKVK